MEKSNSCSKPPTRLYKSNEKSPVIPIFFAGNLTPTSLALAFVAACCATLAAASTEAW